MSKYRARLGSRKYYKRCLFSPTKLRFGPTGAIQHISTFYGKRIPMNMADKLSTKMLAKLYNQMIKHPDALVYVGERVFTGRHPMLYRLPNLEFV